MEAKPFVPSRARKAYLVAEADKSAAGNKENRGVLCASTGSEEDKFNEHKPSAKAMKGCGRVLTDLGRQANTLKATDTKPKKKKAITRNSYYIKNDTEHGEHTSNGAPIDVPVSHDVPPLRAEERHVDYTTPVRLGPQSVETAGDGASKEGSIAEANLHVATPSHAEDNSNDDSSDEDTVRVANLTETTPESADDGDADNHGGNSSGATADAEDSVDKARLVGPHRVVDRTSSATEARLTSPETADTDGSESASSDETDDELAPQPPHHRCLDYTETTMLAAPSPNEEKPVTTAKPTVTVMATSSSAKQAWQGMTLSPPLTAFAAVAVAHPFTPDRPPEMVRYNRGAAVRAAELYPQAETQSSSCGDDLSWLAEGGVSLIPASASVQRTAWHLHDEEEVEEEEGEDDSPLKRCPTMARGADLYEGSAANSALILLPEEEEEEMSASSSCEEQTRDDAVTQVPLVGSFETSICRDPDVEGDDDDDDDDGGSPCSTDGKVGGPEQQPCVPLDQQQQLSERRAQQPHAGVDAAAECPHSGNNTLPLDSSADKQCNSEDGVRAISSSYGCTEQETTPARSSSCNPWPPTDGDDTHSTGTRRAAVNDDDGDNDSNAGAYCGGTTTQSPSPVPMKGGRFGAVERTVEGKAAPSFSAEEDHSVVRTRLTRNGVRLSFDEDTTTTTTTARLSGGVGESAVVDPKATLPSYITDSMLMRVEQQASALLTEWRQAVVSAWTTTVITRAWMPETFATIVGPLQPDAASAPAVAAMKETYRGRRSFDLPACRSIVSPRCGGVAPSAPDATVASPRSAFPRSPASLSVSFRSAAFMSPMLMSPSTVAATGPNGGGLDNANDESGSSESNWASGTFSPLGALEQRGLHRTGSTDTLFEEPPTPQMRRLSTGASATTTNAAVASACDGAADTAPRQMDSVLPMLFQLFCAAEGDATVIEEVLDAYTESCLATHKRIHLHAFFNYGYLGTIATEQLRFQEWMARRQICMSRDLYIRDKIELFVLLAPKTAPKQSDNLFNQVKGSLTNFRKKLFLASEEKKAAREEKRMWAELEKLGKSTSAAAPLTATDGKPPHLGPLRDARAVAATNTRHARTDRKQSLSARRTFGDNAKPRVRRNPVTVVDKEKKKGNEAAETQRARSRARPPTYARRRISQSPLRLPSIEIQAKAAPAIRSREYVAPRARTNKPPSPPPTPKDDDFLDLAQCKEF